MDDVQLLPQILQTFREVCDVLARQESTPERKKFYLHVSARTFILLNLHEELPRVFAGSLEDTKILKQLLRLLDQAVDTSETQSSLELGGTSHVLSALPGLNALLQFWSADSNSDEPKKLSFALGHLDFGSQLRQDDLISCLKDAEEICRASATADRSDPSTEHELQRRQRKMPPLDIWPLAKSVYSVLDSSKTELCGICKIPHGFGARLCIETYRAQDYVKECDFAMFLGLDELWHEARIRSITKSVVRFVIDSGSGDDSPKQTRQKIRGKGGKTETKVKNLCRQIKEARSRWMYRLNFELRDNELWKIPSEQSNFVVDASEEAISLSQFIAEQPHVLNGKTKRILAVLLGYTVLHLYGTGWIQPSWGSENILFFKTSGAIPLKPYLQCHPRSESSDLCPMSDQEEDEDEADPDDDLFYHPYPCLVSLALMLIELHQARPIARIAEEHRLRLCADMSNEDRFLVAGQIFASCKQDFEDQTRMAIDACLDVTIGCDPHDGEADEDGLRSAIYQNIVRRLEDELEQGYSYISVDGLDSLAQTLDFARFGRPIKLEQPQDPIQAKVPQPSRRSTRKRARNDEMETKGRNMQYTAPGGTPPPKLSFFDDQRRPEGMSIARQEAYVSWKESVCSVYDQFLPEVSEKSRVKIAVLDTGIDEDHFDFQARDDRIKGSVSYVDKDRHKVRDANGHGTHVTSLLLDYAPEADVYVVKIAEHDPVSSSKIALAINDAVTSWKPDIITMSFGWPARDDEYEELENAIKNAQVHDVLLFAAASNDGANAKRAWPARHPGVICIHSTSADGTPSPFNPLAVPGDNFSAIGEAVEGAWPRHLCDTQANESCLAYKSGTSYATPIAAGIAAFLLQYARAKLPARHARRLKQFEGMTTVLRRISVEKLGYNYIAPRLHPDNFFGKGEDFVQTNLREALS